MPVSGGSRPPLRMRPQAAAHRLRERPASASSGTPPPPGRRSPRRVLSMLVVSSPGRHPGDDQHHGAPTTDGGARWHCRWPATAADHTAIRTG
ncbi:hypothetical protein SAMN05428965_1963 [Geodermatophilus sp. DSM 45219]|nr:hypothetical protein SAMN05428965_1963 [Geodermatophilus sp. DSM 45219]